jgi:MFS family permease
LVALFLHESVERRPRSIDALGAAAFTVAVGSAMVVFTQGAALPPGIVVGLAALSLTAGTLFWWHEGRAAEAIIPPEVWRDPLVRWANLATLGAGAVMIAVVAYLPTYAQGVLGTSALVAGFTLTTMSMGWPVASVLAGVLMVRLGVRRVARVGSLALLAGSLAFAFMDPSRGPGYAAASSALIGVGMGTLSTTFLVSIQTRVGWRLRGTATATNLLMRILGNALGAAILGGLVNASLLRWLQREGLAGAVRLDDVTRLLDGNTATSEPLLEVVRGGLQGALHAAFLAMAVAAALTVAFAFLMPDLPAGQRDDGEAPVTES